MARHSSTRWLSPALLIAVGVVAGCTSDGNLGQDSTTDGGLPGVAPGQCGTGLDRNGNGVIDEGCICIPGETESCFNGPVSARDTGECKDGTIVCAGAGEFGTWGSQCTGAALPSEERCNGLDDDCDGAIDEGCSCATEGETRLCGRAELPLPCKAGEQTCSGGLWSECVGAVAPQAEQCGNGIDDDCDGRADELCDCSPAAEVCNDGVDNDCDGVVDEDGCIAQASTDAGSAEGGQTDGGKTDSGTGSDADVPVCTGAGDWKVEIPAVLYSGTVSESPGGMIRGTRLERDGHGVLVAGHVIGAKLALNGFAAESTPPNLEGGAIPQDAFVVALAQDGTFRYGYAPKVTPYDPPNPFNAVPGVFAQGLVSDGSGGFWVSGAFEGNMETAPGKQYSTPVPTSLGQMEGDAYLIHVDGSGALVDSRVFGRDGQLDAFGEVAWQGSDLLVACTTSGYFQLDSVPLLPPSARSMSFLTLQPSSGTYGPTRIDYVDPGSNAQVNAMMLATGGTSRRFGVGGNGVLDLAGTQAGQADHGITALLTPTASNGVDVQAFLGTDGYYTYGTSLRMNAGGEVLLSGGLRGTVTFGGALLSSGGATANDGFGVLIASLRADGSHKWSRAIVASPVDPFHSVSGSTAIADDGTVYFAGTFGNQAGSTLDLGSGPVTLPAEAVVFAVYDATGALVWSKIEDHTAYSQGKVLTVADVAADGCGGFYVTGDYWMGTWARGGFVRHVTIPQ